MSLLWQVLTLSHRMAFSPLAQTSFISLWSSWDSRCTSLCLAWCPIGFPSNMRHLQIVLFLCLPALVLVLLPAPPTSCLVCLFVLILILFSKCKAQSLSNEIMAYLSAHFVVLRTGPVYAKSSATESQPQPAAFQSTHMFSFYVDPEVFFSALLYF